ncbi:MAG TPA: hypothetical protein VEH49_10425 [Methylomirabilota bacterium]|nr:hypothetical protein [Methylomirabilota bacterium]
MTQESELILRRALDSVDRNRRRLAIVFSLLTCAVIAFLVWTSFLHDLREMLLSSVAIMLFAMVQGVVALAIYINRMARMILRAIELSSKP